MNEAERIDIGSWKVENDAVRDYVNNLDFTKESLYEIRTEWLGVGDVDLFINKRRVHKFANPGMHTAPFVKTYILPITAEVINVGASAIGNLQLTCAAVRQNGSSYESFKERSFSATVDRVAVAANSTVYGFSFRISPQYPKGSGPQNRMIAYPKFMSMHSQTNRAIAFLYLGTTLTGSPTWAVDPGAGSGVDIDTAATGITGGNLVGQFTVAPNATSPQYDLREVFNRFSRRMRRWSTTAADCDIFSVLLRNDSTGTSTISATVNWGEVR